MFPHKLSKVIKQVGVVSDEQYMMMTKTVITAIMLMTKTMTMTKTITK